MTLALHEQPNLPPALVETLTAAGVSPMALSLAERDENGALLALLAIRDSHVVHVSVDDAGINDPWISFVAWPHLHSIRLFGAAVVLYAAETQLQVRASGPAVAAEFAAALVRHLPSGRR